MIVDEDTLILDMDGELLVAAEAVLTKDVLETVSAGDMSAVTLVVRTGLLATVTVTVCGGRPVGPEIGKSPETSCVDVEDRLVPKLSGVVGPPHPCRSMSVGFIAGICGKWAGMESIERFTSG